MFYTYYWDVFCLIKVNKSKSGNVISGEIVVPRSQDVSPRSAETPKGPENVRIAQLEQNIKFLQEQHHLMLTGLHNEIESLKNRNRGVCVCLLNSFRCFNKNYFLSRTPVPVGVCEGFLAKFWILIFSWRWYKAQSMWLFIYIFQKYNLNLSQIFFSLKNLYKYTYLNILQIYSSPKPFNITPLQVEILEKEMADLKLQLQETESRNLYLSAIVDEQKKYVLYFLWSQYLR